MVGQWFEDDQFAPHFKSIIPVSCQYRTVSQPCGYSLFKSVADAGWQQPEGTGSLSCFSVFVLTDPSERDSAMMQWLTAGKSTANRCFIFSGVMDTWITAVLFSRLTGLLCSHRVIPLWLGFLGSHSDIQTVMVNVCALYNHKVWSPVLLKHT